MKATPLDPARYRRTPWKNGGGVTIDIADEGEVWRFGRTPITTPGPFSDYTGFDRLQVLIKGRGLVLQTPDGEIDVRTPFKPVRFAGETPIVSRLEAGPVEVVNLIGQRSGVRLALDVLKAGGRQRLGSGLAFAYCPAGARVMLAGTSHDLPPDGGLRIEQAEGQVLECRDRVVVVACVSRS